MYCTRSISQLVSRCNVAPFQTHHSACRKPPLQDNPIRFLYFLFHCFLGAHAFLRTGPHTVCKAEEATVPRYLVATKRRSMVRQSAVSTVTLHFATVFCCPLQGLLHYHHVYFQLLDQDHRTRLYRPVNMTLHKHAAAHSPWDAVILGNVYLT